MTSNPKTGDLRNPSALTGLTSVRLFVEVEAAGFSGAQSRIEEAGIVQFATKGLIANGLAVVTTPAEPALYITVIGRALFFTGGKHLIVLRIDTSLRETLQIPRFGAGVTCVTWCTRPEVLVFSAPQSLSNLEAFVYNAIDQHLSAFYHDRRVDNRVGDRIVADYFDAPVHNPGGDAEKVAYDRVSAAMMSSCGINLPALVGSVAFDRLWKSEIAPKASWLALPAEIRGRGAPGALSQLGKGTVLDRSQIWAGALEQGAVLFGWQFAADFQRVQAGDPAVGERHTFIFLRYVIEGEQIVGMKVADQGLQSAAVVLRKTYEVLFAINLHC